MKTIIVIFVTLLSSIVYSQNVSFNELVSFKTKTINQTEQILKKKGYSYYTTQNNGIQWKANDGSGMIGFNGKGVVLFMTYNLKLYNKIKNEMKILKYNHDAKSTNKDPAVESYSKNKNTIYLSTVKNTENNKLLYSITII